MTEDGRAVFFFDIDNCLYPKSKRVHEHMSELIDQYFQTHLSLSQQDANELHLRYYKDYGLAIEGLVRHHKVDPLEYNSKVDDALPLEDILEPNPRLRQLLQDLDTTKVKPWLFTNAYVTHGRRVVKLLGVDDLFEGITFCDYGARPLLCKPAIPMFEKAMRESGAVRKDRCYYVGEFMLHPARIRSQDPGSRLTIEDDSGLNVKGGKAFGWQSVHLVEHDATSPPALTGDHEIRDLEELRNIFPDLFKSR